MSPVTQDEIASYEANLISAGNPDQYAATAWLFRGDGSLAAFCRFYLPEIALPPNEFRQDLNAAIVSYRFDAFWPAVDLLRNEKPVYFTWCDYSDQVPGRMFGVLGTSREPVGELEVGP